MTTQPCLPIFGDHSLETLPPADMMQMSVSEKSYWSSGLTFSVRSPNDTSVPRLRREASATLKLIRNLLSLSAWFLEKPAGRCGFRPPGRTRERVVRPRESHRFGGG